MDEIKVAQMHAYEDAAEIAHEAALKCAGVLACCVVRDAILARALVIVGDTG